MADTPAVEYFASLALDEAVSTGAQTFNDSELAPSTSPVGSFSKRAGSFTKQLRAPGPLILDSFDGESTANRKSSVASLSPKPSFSPRPGKHDDPIGMWPVQHEGTASSAAPLPPCPAARSPSPSVLAPDNWMSPRRSSGSLSGQQRRPSGELLDNVLNDDVHTPRQHCCHSTVGLASPSVLHNSATTSPSIVQVLHTSPRHIHSLSFTAAQPCSLSTESLGSTVPACSNSYSGSSSHASPPQSLAAAATVIGDVSKRPLPKPAVPAAAGALLAGKHLQSQTHAALQQLAVKPTGRKSERLGTDSHVLYVAEDAVQQWPINGKTAGQGGDAFGFAATD